MYEQMRTLDKYASSKLRLKCLGHVATIYETKLEYVCAVLEVQVFVSGKTTEPFSVSPID
jgi:hypothetical protein